MAPTSAKKTTKVYVCSVTNCRYHRTAARWPEPLSFHEFPSDLARRKLWLQALGKEDWTPSDKAKVCSVHFRTSDYRETARKLLKLTAVPCLHLQLDPVVASNDPPKPEEEPLVNAVEPAESSAKPPSDVIVVDLLDRDLRLAASACKQLKEEPEVDECGSCRHMRRQLKETLLLLTLARQQVDEQKKLVTALKRQLKR